MSPNQEFNAQMPAVATRSTPLKGKMVFFDTKTPVSRLREQLEILGARVENFFSKDIWCVITDKQIDEVNKKLLSSAANSTRKRTPFLNRTQTLLQAAQQKEAKKKKDELQTVIQECKQWDIPMLSIKTATSSVSKLMRKYQLPQPSGKKSLTTNPLRKAVSESHLGKVTRLEAHEILKIEDKKQLYRPVFKVFEEKSYPQLRVSQPKSGTGVLVGPFAENLDCLSQKETLGESRKNHPEPSKKTAEVDPNFHLRKRKLDSKHDDKKSKYCEICHEYFTNLRSHLNSASHTRAANDCLTDLEKIVEEFRDESFECSGSRSSTSPKHSRVPEPDRNISCFEV